MSCGCNSSSSPTCGGCCQDNPCAPCPTESAACETLPSALENFITQFFGTVEKSVVDGRVVWTLPCNLAVGLENNPRLLDEGLACYFLRLFQNGITGVTGPQGATGDAGADGHNAFTITLCEFTQPAESGNFQVEVLANPILQAGQVVFINGSGWSEIQLVSGGTLSLTLIQGVASEGTVISIGALVTVTGPRGIPGTAVAQGDTGPQGPQGPQGDVGPQGPAGNDGADAVIGGADTQVQYNDGGVLNGSANLTYSEATGLTSAKNVVINQSTLTYAAITDIDFTGDGVKQVALTGDIEFTTSNRAAGRQITIDITCDGTPRNFVFPAWKFVGAAAPASIAANKVAILTLYCTGAADTDIRAAYAEEP